MARTNIQVIISVKDGATKPLEKVQKGIRNTGKAAKDATSNIWQFNKTLFSTFAFVGLFTKGFSSLKESLMIGAELDKVSTQFERQIGPKSKFISALEGSTNVVIDEMTALRNGLELGNLGITKSVEDAALTIAKFGVAGKLAGKDASSVIDGLTQAVTRGNVSKLEELGIMKASDPAYMALMAVVGKAGGVMGGTIAKQEAMAIVMGAINKRVQGQMFAFMSLGEVIEYTGTAYGNLKRNIGVLLANVMRPLLEKLLPLIQSFNKIVDSITRTDKHTLFLVKTVLALTAGISGLFASLGSLQLIVKLLGFTPLGFGGMSIAIVAVTAAFVGLTRAADGPLAKLKIFGAFFKGIYELINNFDPETGMSKISAATEKLLSDNGILGFVDFIAASIVTVKTALKDIVDFVKWSAIKVGSLVGSIFGSINDGLKSTQKWTTWWTTDTLSSFDKIKRAAMILGGILGSIFIGKKLFGAAGGILSKIPGIGKLFGGGKNHGSSPANPTYTKEVGVVGAISNMGGGILKGPIGLLTGLFSKLSTVIEYTLSYGFSGLRYVLSELLMPILNTFGKVLTEVLAPIMIFGSAVYGAVSGIMETSAEWGKFFGGIWDLGKALGSLVVDLVGMIPYVKTVADGFMNIGKLILVDGPMKLMQLIAEGWKNIFGWMGIGAGAIGEKLSAWTKSIPDLSTKDQKNVSNSRSGGKQTSVSVPTPSVDEESTLQVLGEQMKLMKGADRENMQKTIESALKSPANGGGFIDPEEFATFQNLLTKAFDESKNLQELVNINRDKRVALRTGQRG